MQNAIRQFLRSGQSSAMAKDGFAGLEKNRRLWKNGERWLDTSLPFVDLALLASFAQGL
jgi:hypothetical protein